MFWCCTDLYFHSLVTKTAKLSASVQMECEQKTSTRDKVLFWKRGASIIVFKKKILETNVKLNQSNVIISNITTADAAIYTCYLDGKTVVSYKLTIFTSKGYFVISDIPPSRKPWVSETPILTRSKMSEMQILAKSKFWKENKVVMLIIQKISFSKVHRGNSFLLNFHQVGPNFCILHLFTAVRGALIRNYSTWTNHS